MANPAQNPLFKHFRQPAIYLKLPSMGQFWPEDSLDMPVTGEIPVYPMTVKDEITLKTPDALMNGAGVVNVIQSCCPNIKDAWKVPLSDLDAILIAIRIASYGNDLDITTTCPNCKEENDNTVDLRMLLDRTVTPDYRPVVIDQLQFKLRPQSFITLNKNNQIVFEQTRLLDAITSSELSDEEKAEQFKIIFPKLTEMNVSTILDSIESITLEDGTIVNEVIYIKEFIDNCDRSTYSEIKKLVEERTAASKIDPLNVVCNECLKTYTSDLTFDQANFFE